MFFLKYIFGVRERSFVDEEKPFMSHLEDLRTTLVKIGITVVVSMILCFSFAPSLLNVLRAPVDKVWAGYERSHLPSSIDVEDWTTAKQVAEALPRLTDQGKTALLEGENPQVRELAECFTLLHAMRLLPEKRQKDFLAKASSSEDIIEKVLLLEKNKALTQVGENGSGFKMMSALQPTESFNLSLKLAFYAGLVISFPLLSLFLLEFILPGLKQSERRTLFKAMFVGVGLFLTGVAFAYFVVLPGILEFFFNYSMDMGIANDWRIGFYLNFVLQFIFLFGLSFELPVVVMPFVKMGILTYDMMKASRNYAIVIIFIASALLTPADVLSLFLMAIPMYVLYEVCILLARREYKRQMKDEEAEAERVRDWEKKHSPYENHEEALPEEEES